MEQRHAGRPGGDNGELRVPDYVEPVRVRRKSFQLGAGAAVAAVAVLVAVSAPWGRPGVGPGEQQAAVAPTFPVAGTTTTATVPTTTTPPPRWFVAEVPDAIFGVVTAGTPAAGVNPDKLDRFSAGIASPNVVAWFVKLTDGIQAADLDAAGARGAVPMVTVEPWPSGPEDLPDRAAAGTRVLEDLVAGVYDQRLGQMAATIATYQGPVLIRFAHEANGDWYPWAATNAYHGPDLWIEAYRHVADTLRANGAVNARFVWGVNHINGPNTPVADMFPGESYVDYVGVSGFWTADWQVDPAEATAFEDMFASTFDAIGAVTAKPVFLAETGVALGLDRAWFIEDLLAHSMAGDLAGWVWMEENKIRGDWQLLGDPASSELLRGLIAQWRDQGLRTGADTELVPAVGP